MSSLPHTKRMAAECLDASHYVCVSISEKLIAAEALTKQAVSRQTQVRNVLYLFNNTVKLK